MMFPQLSAVGICRGYLPWEFAVAICHGNLPQVFAVAICRENLGGYLLCGFFCVCKQTFFFFVSKSFSFVSKPF